MSERIKAIKKASWIGITGNALLASFKIAAGFISGSLAVIADGIDSASDILGSVITLFTARIISKPPSKKFPYGYGKADAIATKGLSFVIFFAGAQLLIVSAKKIISGVEYAVPSNMAIIAIVISVIVKLILSCYLFKTGKAIESPMLIANGKNMRNDVFISLSVLTGLIFTLVFQWPVIDIIAALLVSIWIMKVAVQIFFESNIELMDGNSDPTIYNDVFDAIDAVPGIKNPHRVRVRRIGHKFMIAADIEIDGNLSLKKAHEMSHMVEDSIKSSIDNIFDVVIHLEPYGDKIVEKDLGLSREHL